MPANEFGLWTECDLLLWGVTVFQLPKALWILYSCHRLYSIWPWKSETFRAYRLSLVYLFNLLRRLSSIAVSIWREPTFPSVLAGYSSEICRYKSFYGEIIYQTCFRFQDLMYCWLFHNQFTKGLKVWMLLRWTNNDAELEHHAVSRSSSSTHINKTSVPWRYAPTPFSITEISSHEPFFYLLPATRLYNLKMKIFTVSITSSLISSVYSHGYLTIPSSRTRLGNEVCSPRLLLNLLDTLPTSL